MMEDFFDKVQEIQENVNSLRMAADMGRGVRDIENGIKQAERTIKQLTKQKKDVSDLNEILATVRAHLVEVKAAVKAKAFDQVGDILASMAGLRDQFDDEVDELQGRQHVQVKAQGQDLQIPQGFQPFVSN